VCVSQCTYIYIVPVSPGSLFRNMTEAIIHNICSCSLPSWFEEKNPAFFLFVPFFPLGKTS
jgi:hypothetical protein